MVRCIQPRFGFKMRPTASSGGAGLVGHLFVCQGLQGSLCCWQLGALELVRRGLEYQGVLSLTAQTFFYFLFSAQHAPEACCHAPKGFRIGIPHLRLSRYFNHNTSWEEGGLG